MNEAILFSERQKFRQWWMWLILLLVNGLMLFTFCKQMAGGATLESKPTGNGGLIFSVVLTLLVTFLISQISLDTQVRKDGIYVRFFPFRLSFKQYSWTQITRAYIREYNPLMEYGGWGMRYGFFGRGRALNVVGNKGLQLEFTDGTKLLIGTQEPAQLEAVLRQLGRLTV